MKPWPPPTISPSGNCTGAPWPILRRPSLTAPRRPVAPDPRVPPPPPQGTPGSATADAAAEAEVSELLAKRARLLAKLDAAKASGDAAGAAKAERQLVALADGAPISGQFYPSALGATSEAFSDALSTYVATNPDKELRQPAGGAADGAVGSSKKDKKKKGKEAGGAGGGGSGSVDADDFAKLMRLKYMRALAAPGEAVGVVAAQSVGEGGGAGAGARGRVKETGGGVACRWLS